MTGIRGTPAPATPRPAASRPPAPRRLLLLLAVVAVIAVLAVHLAAVLALRTMSHDDAISYLAATGHEGAWAAELADPDGLTTRWATAGAWKDLLRVDEQFAFGRIRADLVDHDIHPPVYFWLLHLAVVALGVGVATGPLLNLLIHLVTAVVLWRLGLRVFTRRGPPVVAALVWAMSPAVVATGLSTRQYSLMACLAVVLVLLGVDLADPRMRPGPGRLAAVVAVTAAGLATQFQFGVVAAAVGSWVAVGRVTGPAGGATAPRRRLRAAVPAVSAVAAAMVVGAVLAVLVTGDVVAMLERQREQAEPFTAAELRLRLPWVLTALGRFAWVDAGGATGRVVGALLVVVTLATGGLLVRRLLRGHGEATGPEGPVRSHAALGVVWCLVAVVVGILGAWLAAVSPRFAIQPRYLAPAWPLLALVLVVPGAFVIGRGRSGGATPLTRLWRVVVALPAAVLLLGMVVSLRPLVAPPDTAPPRALRDARAVVTDNVARGVLPRVVWHLPDDTPVRAAPPGELATAGDAFVPPGDLTGPDESLTFYVSVMGAVAPADRNRVLAAAARQGCVTPVAGSVWGVGDLFAVDAGGGAGDGCRRQLTRIQHSTTIRSVAATASIQ